MRRAGFPWRLLVHERNGGPAHEVRSRPYKPPTPLKMTAEERKSFRKQCQEMRDDNISEGFLREQVIPETEFDELVVGKWLHIEQMDTNTWWMNIGGVTLWVTADRDGNAKRVTVFNPGDYADPVEGCVYDGEVEAR